MTVSSAGTRLAYRYHPPTRLRSLSVVMPAHNEEDNIEAAILDDTPLWKIILKVKLPMVRPAIVMLIFLNTIGALQLFVEPLILNNYSAGVISLNWTPVLYIFNTSINDAQYNLGAAMAVVLGLVIVAISVTSLLFRRRKGEFS